MRNRVGKFHRFGFFGASLVGTLFLPECSECDMLKADNLSSLDLGFLRLDLAGEYVATLNSNTGSGSQGEPPVVSVNIDAATLIWIIPRVPRGADSERSFAPILERNFKVEIDFANSTPRKIGILWDRVYYGSGGALYSEKDTPIDTKCRLALPGKVLRAKSAEDVVAGLKALESATRGRFTRIDIALDDYGKRLGLPTLVESIQKGHGCGFRKSALIIGLQGGSLRNRGWCLYLGSRESEKMVRYYDKFAESGGKEDCFRWECEYKGATSHAAWERISVFSRSLDISMVLRDLALGTVNFIVKKDRNLDRGTVCEFWSEWISYVKSVPLRLLVVRRKTSIDRKIKWISSQVARSLSLISIAVGSTDFMGWITDLVAASSEKFSAAEFLLIKEHFSIGSPFIS